MRKSKLPNCFVLLLKMIKVNVRKGLETYKLQQAGKDAGDMIFDFKKVINFGNNTFFTLILYTNENLLENNISP